MSEAPQSECEHIKSSPTVAVKNSLSFSIIMLFIFMIISSNSLSLYLYHTYYAQKIVSLDAKSYIDGKKLLFLKGTITEKELLDSVSNIDMALNRVSKNTVVLLEDSVVRNATKVKIE